MIRSFSDLEIEQVMAAAAPLPPEHRAEFLRLVVNELGASEPGPGAIYRAIAAIQRRFLSPAEGRKTAGKYR